jgi:hypothetical protein
VRFHLVFELVFHILINMPVALAALFLIFTRGVIVGVLVGFVSLFVVTADVILTPWGCGQNLGLV